MHEVIIPFIMKFDIDRFGAIQSNLLFVIKNNP